jgi:hypothetical protein
MADAFQSKPIAKLPKARVEVVRAGQKSEVLSGETINSVAMAFLKQLKGARVKSEGA